MSLWPVLFALMACSTPPELGPDPDATARTANMLCTLLAKADTECTASGGHVITLGHTLDLLATKTMEHRALGTTTFEHNVSVRVDGQEAPQLLLLVAGAGSSPGAALDQAATVWVSVLGAALADRLKDDGRLTFLQRLQDDQAPPPAFQTKAWVAYPGWTILLGQRTEAKPVDIQALLDAAAPIYTAWPTPEGSTHVLQVYAEVQDGALVDPRCTVDGQPSRQLCDLAVTVPLPRGHYVLRQSFVLRPGLLAPPPPHVAPAE